MAARGWTNGVRLSQVTTALNQYGRTYYKSKLYRSVIENKILPSVPSHAD